MFARRGPMSGNGRSGPVIRARSHFQSPERAELIATKPVAATPAGCDGYTLIGRTDRRASAKEGGGGKWVVLRSAA